MVHRNNMILMEKIERENDLKKKMLYIKYKYKSINNT